MRSAVMRRAMTAARNQALKAAVESVREKKLPMTFSGRRVTFPVWMTQTAWNCLDQTTQAQLAALTVKSAH